MVIVIGNACTNDFLFENFKYINGYVYADTTYLNASTLNQNVEYTIPDIGENRNAPFQVRQYPDWVVIDKLKGSLNGNVLSLKYSMNSSYNITDAFGHLIIEIEGVGLINIVLTNSEEENSGTIVSGGLSVNPILINFGEEYTTNSFTISNTSNSAFQYQIISYPEWISINSQYLSGNLENSYSYQTIQLTCNRLSGLAAGSYEGKIVVVNNSVTLDTVEVTVRMIIPSIENPSNITVLSGNVSDAIFDKASNKLYIVTQSPNKLIVLNTNSNTIQTISLTKSPGSIKLSENGLLIFIGQNHLLTVLDAATLNVTKSIELTIDVFDLMYGENNWCYLVAKSTGVDTSAEGSRYVNIQTGTTIYPTYSYSDYYQKIDQSSHILKVKNKELAITTRTNTSPQGLFLFQLKNDSLKIVKYWHESTGARFWSAEDGSFVMGDGGYSIEPTSIGTANLNVLGRLKADDSNYSYYSYQWLDHCKMTNSIWAVNGTGSTYDQASLIEFDANDYMKKRIVNYTINYVTSVNGIIGKYKTEPYYVFSNKNGNKLFLLKNLKTEYKTSSWSIETVSLN